MKKGFVIVLLIAVFCLIGCSKSKEAGSLEEYDMVYSNYKTEGSICSISFAQ